MYEELKLKERIYEMQQKKKQREKDDLDKATVGKDDLDKDTLGKDDLDWSQLEKERDQLNLEQKQH